MTEMKKCYLKPETEVVVVEAESILAGTGGSTYDPTHPADAVPQNPDNNPWLNP